MYYKALYLSLLLAISLPVQAANLLYGIAVINQDVDVSVSSGGTTLTSTEDGSGFGVFADMYYRGTYRFNGTVSYVDYTDFYIISATASADYLIPINDRFTLFAGVTAGGISQKYSDSSVSDMALSYLGGVQLGGIMVAGEHVMVELGFRQRFTDLETDLTSQAAVATVDEITETYISLNLMF
jgi:hypothetical protein